MIAVKNLQKSFGGLNVLDGIDLDVEQGDVIVLVGPSGCGKSTFLRCLTHLEEPTGGQIFLDGKEVKDRDIDQVRSKMGMVFQHFNLFPHMTVKKNITLAPVLLKKKTQAEADKQAMELLERIGLADKAEHALRRTETANRYRARAGYGSGSSPIRRAYKCSRSRDGRGGS